MDTPIEEQQIFQKVTCNIAASEDEITEPGMLSADFINHVSRTYSLSDNVLYLARISKLKFLTCKLVIKTAKTSIRSRLKFLDWRS